MLDRLTDNPLVFFLGLIVMVPIAVWVLAVINWMIQGEIDAIVGVSSLFVAFGLAFITIQSRDPVVTPLTFFAVLCIMCCYPFVAMTMRNREMAKIDVEQIGRVYEQLAKDKENPVLLFRLAELLYARGYRGQAASIGNRIRSQLEPANLFRTELSLIQSWLLEAKSSEAFKACRCPACGTLNPVSEAFCRRCGEPHMLYVAQGMWAGKDVVGQVLAGLSVGLIGLVGFPYVLSLGLPIWAISLVVVFMALAIILLVGRAFFHVFRGDG
ncbi:MAG: zinc ribbon domain-containing protein [Fimbriimonadaceae bacterium]|jgi:hypothetical protein|nr:zinc ribbon domain-containing protein [Fimbriimonadaceae bacterium]